MYRILKLATAIVVIAVVGFGAFFVWRHTHDAERLGERGAPSVGQVDSITYDGTGFEPQSLHVRKGERVRIINQSSSNLLIVGSSSKSTDLEVGTIDPGVSKSITMTHAGTWSYYNQRASSQQGSITVSEN